MDQDQLIIDIGVDAGKAHKELPKVQGEIKGVGDEAEKTSTRGNKLGAMFDVLGKGALVAGASVLGLGGLLVGAAKAASDEQVGMDRLYTTLKNTIPGWDGNTVAIEKYVSQQEKMAFADDQIRDSLNQLVGVTHNLKEAQDLQATAMDLARAKGIDLMTASKLVGKVDMDNIGVLKKLGIQIDDHATKEEALAAIRAQTAGQAETYANSAAGSMDRLQTSLGDAFETIGHAVLDIVSGPLKSLADWISSDAVQSGIQQVANFVGVVLTQGFQYLGNVLGWVWSIVQPFGAAIGSFFSTLQNGGSTVDGLGTMFTNLGSAIGNAWSIIAPALGTLLGNIIQWIGDNGPAILATLASWGLAFAQWVWNDAIPWMLGALGGLALALWNWIGANGPAILQTLGQWAQVFGAWVWDKAIPWMLEKLGDLLSALWKWIGDNGPSILQTLGQWAQAFGSWVWDKAIPWLFEQLGNLMAALLKWIQDNGPGILQTLGQWATAFGDWIINTAIPWMLEKAWDLLSALTGWLLDNAPKILSTLVEWSRQFAAWVITVALNIPIWLVQIGTQIWAWISSASQSLAEKLAYEWIPAMWQWITGPGGVLETIGSKLAQIAQKVWDWITSTASSAFTKVQTIGDNIVQGIRQGISNAWQGFLDWIHGLLGSLPQIIKDYFHISSPSGLMADEVGAPLVQGIQAGWDREFPTLRGRLGEDSMTLANTVTGGLATLQQQIPSIIGQLAGAYTQIQGDLANTLLGATNAFEAALAEGWDATWGMAQQRAQEIIDLMGKARGVITDPAFNDGGSGMPGAGGGGGGGARGYARGGRFGGGEWIRVGEEGPELIRTGGGGSVIPNDALQRSRGGDVHIYFEGVEIGAEQLAQKLGLRVRTAAARS